MDSSVSPKDEIWFLRVCHHISTGLYFAPSSLLLLCVYLSVSRYFTLLPFQICLFSSLLYFPISFKSVIPSEERINNFLITSPSFVLSRKYTFSKISHTQLIKQVYPVLQAVIMLLDGGNTVTSQKYVYETREQETVRVWAEHFSFCTFLAFRWSHYTVFY